MAYPYTVTTGGLISTIRQLRSAFPPEVNADTLKKWGIAPNNESYIVNILKFLNLIDDHDQRRDHAAKVFANHDDDAFAEAFGTVVRDSYAGLFELHGDAAWEIDKDLLITFFKAEDQTSTLVAKRQASTFQVLAAFAGHRELPNHRASSGRPSTKRTAQGRSRSKKKTKQKQSSASPAAGSPAGRLAADGGGQNGRFQAGLTLRIELNLPVTDDQTVYDKIFKSIRENLIDE